MHRVWNSADRPKVAVLISAIRPRRLRAGGLLCLALAGLAGLLVAGCGGTKTGAGSGASARSLLKQTFSGIHNVKSGKLAASVTLTPSGSTLLSGPLSLSFGGPFQSSGKGQLPESDFSVGIGYAGHTGKLGILSTGKQGYVTMSGTAYKLPASSFKKLESGFSAAGGSSGSAAANSTLSGLGIHPEQWLIDPEVVGTATVGGVQTDHIHGKLAVGPLVADLSKLMAKADTLSAGSSTTAGSTVKPPTAAQQKKLAAEVHNASFDLWTGSSDHTIRKLTVTATLPVSGKTSTEFGGLTSATLTLNLGYSDIGQHQTITAPATAKPYKQFEQRFSATILEIEELAVAGTAGSTSSSGSSSSGSSSSGSSSSGSSTSSSSGGLSSGGGNSAYDKCLNQAGGNVAKMQKCASVLNGGG